VNEERKGTRGASKRAERAQRAPEANSRVSSNGLNREHHTSRQETPQDGLRKAGRQRQRKRTVHRGKGKGREGKGRGAQRSVRKEHYCGGACPAVRSPSAALSATPLPKLWPRNGQMPFLCHAWASLLPALFPRSSTLAFPPPMACIRRWCPRMTDAGGHLSLCGGSA
jgi:hypothetical protein